MKKYIQILFAAMVFLLLAGGLLRSVFLPKDINYYENRYASVMTKPTLSGWMDGSWQSSVDDALMDQIPMAQRMKATYNRLSSRFDKSALDTVSRKLGLTGEQYVNYNGMRLFGGDHIVYYPRYVESVQTELEAKQNALNATFAKHPDVDFYVYYIEKDTDIDFESQVKTETGDWLLQRLSIPEEHKGIFRINSFDEFADSFYKTDAHWQYLGSYRGYRELLELLKPAGSPVIPSGEPVLVSDCFSGKKASAIAAEGVMTEPFYAYPFDFPALDITVNGQAGQYGHQEEFLNGTMWEEVSYGGFYGDDNGETIFRGGQQDGSSILVIGESFDNALLRLLACHYEALYSIDLRYYEYSMGKPFDFSAYLAEHNINQVLLMGNIDFYIQDTFDPEG